MAQNLENLEKLGSLGGSISHLGHITRKIYFLKNLFIFATLLGIVQKPYKILDDPLAATHIFSFNVPKKESGSTQVG